MKYDFQYQSGARSFEADFGRVTNATDGGFERGYAAGYTEGETTGYTKGQAEGYEVGHAQGYTEGEQTAKAAAEAHNAEILADCNSVLPTKGASTAETLEQVPKRIDEIQSYAEGYDVGVEDGKQQAIENLPTPYLKIDPSWKSLAFFCAYDRGSLLRSMKYSDTANVTNFQSFCANWSVTDTTVIPSLDYSNATTIQGIFQWDWQIVEIGEMNIPKVTNTTGAFTACEALTTISFVPGCIHVSIGFQYSDKLSDASIQSIIDGLADLTGATAQTLTFHATVGAKLTEAQKATITAKNWTLVY